MTTIPVIPDHLVTGSGAHLGQFGDEIVGVGHLAHVHHLFLRDGRETHSEVIGNSGVEEHWFLEYFKVQKKCIGKIQEKIM